MKKLLLLILALLALLTSAHAQTRVAFATLIVTNTSTTVPVQLVTTNLNIRSCTIYGLRSARVVNTGDIYLGTNPTNDYQFLKITTAAELVISMPPDRTFNLSSLYLDVVTANDGVVIIYQ